MGHCLQCGLVFKGRPLAKYCSHKCHWDSLKTGCKVICPCGKEVYSRPSQSMQKKFCSLLCSSKWKPRTPRRGKFKKCQQCQKEFYATPRRTNKVKFCSLRCTDEHKKNGKLVNCRVCGKELY